MTDHCFDCVGISKEKKDAKDVKENRGVFLRTILLRGSSQFYKVESQEFIESCDCGDYLKKAEKRLCEEIDRVGHYLDAKTEDKITSVVEKEMIANHMQRLVHRVTNGLATVRDVMTSHLRLWKGLKGIADVDVEVVLDKVMMMFRYLQEKDVFEKYYKQHLAKRLLSGKTVSDDAEISLIN
ncbi:hypothetical protein Bca52824_014094 [Brassica carinata]|uniref:Cullin family profile domain-containing protein n=1 Tax=Brassica carinata TaxID=52824 RepID=A0A8X7W043_BRACI|nr:hypothetical protein Bca52824_014094 [Brassica carinata]